MAATAGPGMGPGPGGTPGMGSGPVPVPELVAELRGRDGQARSVRVPYPAAERGGAAELRGLRRALGELRERVSELLAPLVQQERRALRGGGAGEEDGDGEEEEEDEEDEDEGDEENHVEARAGGDPPPKRPKVQRP